MLQSVEKFLSLLDEAKQLKNRLDAVKLEQAELAKVLSDQMLDAGVDHQKTSDGRIFRVEHAFNGGFKPETFDAFVAECEKRNVECPAKAKATYKMALTPQVTMEMFAEVHEAADSVAVDCVHQSFNAFMKKNPWALDYAEYVYSPKGKVTKK